MEANRSALDTLVGWDLTERAALVASAVRISSARYADHLKAEGTRRIATVCVGAASGSNRRFANADRSRDRSRTLQAFWALVPVGIEAATVDTHLPFADTSARRSAAIAIGLT